MGRIKDGRPRSLPGELTFLAPPADIVKRQVKYELPLEIPRGEITKQVGPALTGKTERANAWMAKDPENRRVVDGDRKEAQRLADQGYAVKKAFAVEQLEDSMKGIEARTDAGVLDEITYAYKDLDSVIEAQSDLVEVVQKLDTILCVKG